MRRRLTLLLAVGVLLPLLAPSAASAQAPPVGGDAGGSDQTATGSILGDGTAEVIAGTTTHTGGGSSLPHGTVACTFHEAAGEAPAVGLGDVIDPYQPLTPSGASTAIRVCKDTLTGELVSLTLIPLPLTPGAEIDPRDLADLARARLDPAAPQVEFSPPLATPDDYLLVRLPAWIWVDNWAAQSQSATAGAVTATVTARPVRQEWDFDPSSRDLDLEGGCGGPGARYDQSRPAESQSTDCSFTFTRSSADQPEGRYDGRLTVVYELTWTSNVGAGGDLGELRRTAAVPVRVAEQQALNESGGTHQ